MSGQLAGGVILVTGAARGIGRAIALACASEGADVGIVDIDADGLAGTAELIGPSRKRVSVMVGDLSDRDTCERAVEQTIDALGSLTGLVNNAAVLHEANTVATTDEQWAETIDVNLKAPWMLARASIPRLVDADAGAIVNIASIEAHSVRANHAAYVVAKSGLLALTRAIAVEYGRNGVRCNSISPGSIATEMFRTYVEAADDPSAFEESLVAMNYRGRLGMVDEIATATVFLLSAASGFTNGADLIIDGGRLAAT